MDSDEESLANFFENLDSESEEIYNQNDEETLESPNSEAINKNEDSEETNEVDVYEKDVGPNFYTVRGRYVTPPIDLNKFLGSSEGFFEFGKREENTTAEEFDNKKIRDFVGCDLTDAEFDKLAKYCSIDNLKTGLELTMPTKYPSLGSVDKDRTSAKPPEDDSLESEALRTVIYRRGIAKNVKTEYLLLKRLKYRGVHMMDVKEITSNSGTQLDLELEPGKDMIFQVRVYRTGFYNSKESGVSTHMSKKPLTLKNVITLCGKNNLAQLRDEFNCINDISVRADVSSNPYVPGVPAKCLFPAGYFFINNVFYTDDRNGLEDLTINVREWAANKGKGEYPVKSMSKTYLEDMILKLGHAEVYIHQGDCEHLFTFSDIRLVTHHDVLSVCSYPCHTANAGSIGTNCMACAEYVAKWLVTECKRLPFDPAYLCDPCFRMYLYKDGEKIGDFKAYQYKISVPKKNAEGQPTFL